MGDEELLAWLTLTGAQGLGDTGLRRLLGVFGSPQAAWQAGPDGWHKLIGPAAIAGLSDPDLPARASACAERTRAWMDADPGARRLLSWGDPDYPGLLLETADPPPLLYAVGRMALTNAPGIAMVGSRRPTAQGLDHARGFAEGLSQAGWCVVSGLAQGIDGAAHEGALAAAGGTVAVVGTGLDRVYPKRHLDLAHRIAQHGLLLSEFPLGTPPLAANFPRRNRVIAGMSRGTLVVEAALQSGSLITARLASEAGREVWAIPGSIQAPQSQGCHWLIQQGAALVQSPQEVLASLTWLGQPSPALAAPVAPSAAPPVSDHGADPVLAALGHDPVSLDALMARCGWSAAALGSRLLELELEGRVARLPGGLFQRRAAA